MKPQNGDLPIKLPAQENKPVVVTLIAYQDQCAGLHARDVFEHMVRKFQTECEFRHDLINMESLSVPTIRDLALEEAMDADMIILACHDDHELDSEVRQWCESWAGSKRDQEAVVVGVFDACPENGVGPARAYIEHLSLRGKMTFIPHLSSRHHRAEDSSQAALHGTSSGEAWHHGGLNE